MLSQSIIDAGSNTAPEGVDLRDADLIAKVRAELRAVFNAPFNTVTTYWDEFGQEPEVPDYSEERDAIVDLKFERWLKRHEDADEDERDQRREGIEAEVEEEYPDAVLFDEDDEMQPFMVRVMDGLLICRFHGMDFAKVVDDHTNAAGLHAYWETHRIADGAHHFYHRMSRDLKTKEFECDDPDSVHIGEMNVSVASVLDLLSDRQFAIVCIDSGSHGNRYIDDRGVRFEFGDIDDLFVQLREHNVIAKEAA